MPKRLTRDYVEHFMNSDAQNSWKRGVLGFFSRLRGLLSTVIIDLACGGFIAYYMLFNTHETLYINIYWLVIIIVLLLLSATAAIWPILRHYKILVAKQNEQLHSISHFVRDTIIKASAMGTKTYRKNKKYRHVFKTFCDQLCDRVREYFRTQIRDETIKCCLRIAEKSRSDKTAPVHYVTFGRSNGFSQNRERTSQPIAANRGIPRYFAEKSESHGVLIYHDLDKAERTGLYARTKNDELFPNEYRTLLVAPINGLDTGRKVMLGLLFVTSCTDPFEQSHTDSICSIVDIIGAALPQIVQLFRISLEPSQ